MGILIGNYEFDGPLETALDLQDQPGIYADLHFKQLLEKELEELN